MSSYVKKIKAGRIGSLEISANTYVGDHGTIFYDEELGDLRLSDGITPGGIPLSFGGNGGGGYNGGNAGDAASSYSGAGGGSYTLNLTDVSATGNTILGNGYVTVTLVGTL